MRKSSPFAVVLAAGALASMAACSSGTTDLSNSVSSLQSEVEVLKSAQPDQGAVESLNNAVLSVQSAISSMQHAPLTTTNPVPASTTETSASTSPTESPAPSPTVSQTVRNSGPILLVNDGKADLDSTSSDWSESAGSHSDITRVSGSTTISALGTAQMAVLDDTTSGTPDPAKCPAALAHPTQQIDVYSGLKPGAIICVITDEGRFATVQYVRYDGDGVHLTAKSYGP